MVEPEPPGGLLALIAGIAFDTDLHATTARLPTVANGAPASMVADARLDTVLSSGFGGDCH
jgi:hypothetical protein